jgi:hypothetical protein
MKENLEAVIKYGNISKHSSLSSDMKRMEREELG